MSKAGQIRDLIEAGLPRPDIAAQVGCDVAYVRAVEQRWKAGPGKGPDSKYIKKNWDRLRARAAQRQRERYGSDPDYRYDILRKRRERRLGCAGGASHE